MGPLLKTTAIAAGVSAAALIPYNVNATVNDRGFDALGALATDLLGGAGAGGVAALGGLTVGTAAILKKKLPTPAFSAVMATGKITTGIGLGVLAGSAAGLGSLILANHIKQSS